MRKLGNSASASGRLLHLGPGLRQAIEAAEVYHTEARADDTAVRTNAARPIRDVRPIETIARAFQRHGFLRIHRRFLVNLCHIRLVRRRARSEDWELTLEPPVGKVLPVSRHAGSSMARARRGLRPFRRSLRGSTIRHVRPTNAEVHAMLVAFTKGPRATSSVALTSVYTHAIERCESLPENAEGADSWVGRCQRRSETHFAKARIAL